MDGHMKTLQLVGSAGAALAFSLSASLTNAANLVSNGDFDNDLTGWVVGTIGTGVTWQDGEARIGQPGTPGAASLSQTLSSGGATSFSVHFDYLWQVALNDSNKGDTFGALFTYESNSQLVSEAFLTQSAENGFVGLQSFNDIVTLNSVPDFGSLTIEFFLLEHSSLPTPGTRVHLDNVAVSAVPIPAAAWLFGSALVGFFGLSRRKSAQA
jgi:hypothetical protein